LSETVEQNPCSDSVTGTANRLGVRTVLIVRSSRVQRYQFLRGEIESNSWSGSRYPEACYLGYPKCRPT